MDSQNAAILLTKAVDGIATQLTHMCLMDEWACVWSEWKERGEIFDYTPEEMEVIDYIISQLGVTAVSMTGAMRCWFDVGKFKQELEDEANWSILTRVVDFWKDHDVQF